MASENPVRIHYSEDPHCVTSYANGAYGGVSPKGEIVVNFFVDMAILPSAEGFLVDEAGNVRAGTEYRVFDEDQEEEKHFERRIVARVIMNPASAQLIATWLNNKVNEMLSGRDRGETK